MFQFLYLICFDHKFKRCNHNMYESNLVSLFIEIDINFLGMKKLENAYKLNTHILVRNSVLIIYLFRCNFYLKWE